MNRDRAAFTRFAQAVCGVAVAFAAASASAQTDAALDPAQPLPDTVRQAFLAVPADPPPPALTRASHYWVSNEDGHWALRESIADAGGVYIGVGAEQNYLLAGWARSAFVIMLDFDQQIVNLHDAYGAIFRAAESHQEFLAYWSDSRLTEVQELIAATVPPERADAVSRTIALTLERCGRRLRSLARQYDEQGVPSFVNDATEYAFVRNLWLNGRVMSVRGDLTADRTMVAIAEVARAQGMPVRLVYLSNAEQYFEYTPQTVTNLVSQPYDERSWVLHTRQYGNWSRVIEGNYHYALQPGPNLVAWLSTGRVSDFISMTRRNRRDQGNGVSFMDVDP